MSTTYSATATKDKDSKDKDSTETSTYVRSSTDNTSDSTTTGGNKSTTGKNKSSTNTDSDKHDQDNTSSTQYRSSGTTGQYGSNTTGSSNQYGQDYSSQSQQRGGGSSTLNQHDVQQKLKEVGNLLQKAGHLLQDLQGSTSDFQSSSWNSSSRGQGGNYSGPFDQSHSSGQGHLGQSWGNNRFEGERSYGMQSGRFQDSDRDEMRGMSTRGGMYGGGRMEDRFESPRGPMERGTDRFSGFGGPNRPDMAYGQQYGQQRGGFQGEMRHGSEFESSGRRGGDRW